MIVLLSIVGTLIVGWFKPAIEKRFNSQNKKVEQVQKKEDDAKSAINSTEKTAVIDAHKDVKSSGYALLDGNIPLASKFNSRADSKLTAVDGGIDPLVVQSLRDEVTNLQSQNAQIRQDAERRLAVSDKQSEAIFQQLTDQRAQLLKVQADLRVATDNLQVRAALDAELAEKYKRLTFAFWAAVALIGIVLAYGLYTRLFTVKDVLRRVAGFTNDVKTAVGPETNTAIIHNLDVNLDDWMQKIVSDARKLLPAPTTPVPAPNTATP